MKSIKTKAVIYILLICLLTVPLSGIIGVHADSPEDLSQEVIMYPSSEEELMPTAMASATINPGYLVLKVSQTANLTATYFETSTNTTQPIWGAEDSSIVSLSTETGTTTTVTADEVGVTTIYFIKGEVSASIPVYVVESDISGTFYVENIFTKRLMDLSSASSEDGTVIQQRNILQRTSRYSSGLSRRTAIIIRYAPRIRINMSELSLHQMVRQSNSIRRSTITRSG